MAKPDWITLSKSSGSGNDTVTVTAARNVGTAPRNGAITVRSGSISKIVTVSQEGSQGHLKWLSQPLWEDNFDQRGVSYDSSQVQIKNLSESYNLESVTADVFQINGEEVSPLPTINHFDNDSLGMEISMTIDSYDNVNKIANVTFSLKITDYALLQNWLDIQANGSGTVDNPFYTTLTIAIRLAGFDGQVVSSDYITLSVYEQAVNSELILNPESNDLPIEGSVEFEVYYADMLGGTITFNLGTEMQNSDGAVYMGNWIGDTSSDPLGKNNSGTIRFYINASGSASAGTYTFEVTGRNNKGQTYSAFGEVYVS